MRKRKESGSDLELGGDPRRLTPIDVQQQQFRRSFRGYDEQEVDDFLDRVTEELSLLVEEKRTAQDRGGVAPVLPAAAAADSGQVGDATRAAEDIKRSAREQAEAIVRDAQARAAAIVRDAETRAGSAAGPASREASPGAGTAALSSFVSREREFLQRLAQLVQGHAEGVRDMVQAARRAPQAAPAVPISAPPAPASPAPAASPHVEAPAPAPSPSEPEAPTQLDAEAPPAPVEPEPPSASIPPETAVDGPAEGGPLMEAAAAEPAAPRAGVVLLPEAAELDEEPEPETTPAAPGEISPVESTPSDIEDGEPSRSWSSPEPPRLPDLPAPPEFAEPAPRASASEPAHGALPTPAASDRSVPVPGRASERGTDDDDPSREQDREATLRELFWGED